MPDGHPPGWGEQRHKALSKCTECGGTRSAHAEDCSHVNPRMPQEYKYVNGVRIPIYLEDETEPELDPVADLQRIAFENGEQS